MKVVLVKFAGDPCVGDTVYISYRATRGGRCGAAHTAREITETTPVDGGNLVKVRCETRIEVIDQLMASISKPGNWTGDFQLKRNEDTLVIMCPDSHSDGTVASEVDGTGTLTVSISEI